MGSFTSSLTTVGCIPPRPIDFWVSNWHSRSLTIPSWIMGLSLKSPSLTSSSGIHGVFVLKIEAKKALSISDFLSSSDTMTFCIQKRMEILLSPSFSASVFRETFCVVFSHSGQIHEWSPGILQQGLYASCGICQTPVDVSGAWDYWCGSSHLGWGNWTEP